MPSILLINENKIVSRLLQLSSQKQGYNLEELNNLGSSSTTYDVIFVDSDLFDDELLQNIESKFTYNYLGYIGAKKDTIPSGFDISIEKPFLPTDFVNLIKEKVISSISEKSPVSVDEDILSQNDELDIDDETEILLNDDKLELDTLDDVDDMLELDDLELDNVDLDEEELLDDVDLSLDPSSVMSTGIVANMMQSENSHEELAGMVSEIDNMDEKELTIKEDEVNEKEQNISEVKVIEEVDKNEQNLEEEESIVEKEDLNEQEQSISQEIGIEEEVEEIEQNIVEKLNVHEDNVKVTEDDVSQDIVNEEVEQNIVEEVLTLEKDTDSEEIKEDNSNDGKVGVGALAAVGAIASSMMNEEKVTESNDEFDSLDEAQLQEALGEEVKDEKSVQEMLEENIEDVSTKEEILSEEIDPPLSVEDETMVESNDVEKWIKDAVAKAITPDMIKEALDGMDINVTLSFNSKKED